MSNANWIWFDNKMVPWQQATTHVLSHTLHYGGGAFEGIRFYQTDRGPAIFRLEDHVERLLYSCKSIGIELSYNQIEIEEAIKETVRRNKLAQGYIRPLAFLGEGNLRIVAKDLPVHLIIAAWPLGDYLASSCADVKVSDFIRIHPKSTITDAKLCGHYVNSIIASLSIRNTKYHESLLLDYAGNIAEGPGENFFCVIDNVVTTPVLGNILAGITRSTILELSADLGFKVQEINLALEDALKAQEAFFSGTAVEVTAIRSLNDSVFGDGAIGPITKKIKKAYFDLIQGKNEKYSHYLTIV